MSSLAADQAEQIAVVLVLSFHLKVIILDLSNVSAYFCNMYHQLILNSLGRQSQKSVALVSGMKTGI